MEKTTPKLKRENDFEKFNSEVQQKGYTIKNMTINIRQANFLGPLSMLSSQQILPLFQRFGASTVWRKLLQINPKSIE